LRVVVCGAGVIGACCAFFLSRRGAEVRIIERRDAACAASGKSGGFLALDWCDGSPIEALARRSFALHAELAGAGLGDWGYRRVDTLSVAAVAGRAVRGGEQRPPWLSPHCAVRGRLGTTETTAQIDPAGFTRAMLRAAQRNGTGFIRGTVDHIAGGPPPAVSVDGQAIEADAVVIAMGPWSTLAGRWIDLPAVHALEGQSLIFDRSPVTTAHNLFVDYRTEDGQTWQPEIVPRPDGTLYACGLSRPAELPADPADILPDADRQNLLETITKSVIHGLAGRTPVTRQACSRPITDTGLPMIGAHPAHAGIFIATGHSVWGMLNGPATGEAIAEAIFSECSPPPAGGLAQRGVFLHSKPGVFPSTH